MKPVEKSVGVFHEILLPMGTPEIGVYEFDGALMYNCTVHKRRDAFFPRVSRPFVYRTIVREMLYRGYTRNPFSVSPLSSLSKILVPLPSVPLFFLTYVFSMFVSSNLTFVSIPFISKDCYEV